MNEIPSAPTWDPWTVPDSHDAFIRAQLENAQAVAKVAVEALDRLVNHLAVTRHNGWQRCCSAERDAAREALAKIEASGWRP